MQVTKELMSEHDFIIKYLDLLEKYVESSQSNNQENPLLEKAQDFCNFIQQFADTYHHAKEEDILFRYLEAPGVLSHCNPLPVMLSEHNQGRMFVQNMNDAVANEDVKSLCKNAFSYSQLLRQHIFKENNVLYPMAEEGLSDENKIAIEKEYKQIEEKLDKQKIWDKFEAKYSELESCLNSETA